MDYLIMMSEKYLFFRKRRKHLARTFFTHLVEVTGSMYFRNIFRIISLPKLWLTVLKVSLLQFFYYCRLLWSLETHRFMKIINFNKSWIIPFKFLHINETLSTVSEKLVSSAKHFLIRIFWRTLVKSYVL